MSISPKTISPISPPKPSSLSISLIAGEKGQVPRMSNAFRVKVAPNSASVEEARKRVFEFFKEACRSLPSVMEIYNLYDIATVSQLRSNIAAQIRKNAHVNDPKVIDMLVFKGAEELGNVVEQAKQRHHIIGQYVVGREDLFQDSGAKGENVSPFLKNFYTSNYF